MDAPLSALRLPALVIGGFGIFTTLGSWPPVALPTWMLVDALAWPPSGLDAFATAESRLALAILGGVLLGWGVTLWSLSRGVAIPRAALHGMLAWFCLDSLGSVLAGAAANVLPNIAFLALLVGPILLASRRQTA
ncbi:MAG: hypothetical protein AAF919_17345 [Pseudomonadota bacterium]